ncbi:MAG: TolC family protein [Elusimicrobiota bacterium]
MLLFALAAALLSSPAAAASGGSAVVVSSAAAPDVKPISLDEAYAAALKRSEAVAEKGETYAQLMAQIDVLWSSVKPRLNLNASQTWQDTQGPGGTFPIPANQEVAAINGHQPLFAGLRDFLAVKAGKAEGESADFAYRRAKQVLYQDVANAYLNLLESRRDIATHSAQVKLTSDRVKELKNFEDIGRSRKSEVLAAEAQQAQDVADLETSRGLERVQQATLRFLTGFEEDLGPEEIAAPSQAEDVAPFLERSAHRPDVEGARRDLEYADLYVSIQRRQYWPTINLDGNYYLRRTQAFYGHVKWDATVSGQLPIYYGGQIGAQTRQAQAQRGFNEQALSLALRTAELDVRSAHSDLVSDLSIVAALQKAMTLAEENAKAQAADYRHGLVTNIDVLTSLTTIQNTRLRLDAAQIQAFYARVRLEVAAGGPEAAR